MSERSMTSRERILAAVRGEIPDVVPVCPRGLQPLRQVYGGEWPSQSAMIRASRELDFDCMLTWGPAERFAPGVDVIEQIESGVDSAQVRLTVIESSFGKLEKRQFVSRPMTEGAYASSLTSATTSGGMVRTADDVAILETLYARTEAEDVEPFVRLAEEMGQSGVVQGEVANPVNMAVRDVGAEALMMMYLDDPELAKRILGVYQRLALWQAEALLDAGAEIIYSDGVWCTTDLWSRAHIEDLISPLIRGQARLAHQAGAYFHLFMDGNCMAALESIAGMEVDILSPLETPPSGDADVAAAKRSIGDRVCLEGGVNAYWDIMHGSRAHVWRAVEQAICAGGPGGRFILSTADSVYEPCPLENVLEFLTAGRDLGRYPM